MYLGTALILTLKLYKALKNEEYGIYISGQGPYTRSYLDFYEALENEEFSYILTRPVYKTSLHGSPSFKTSLHGSTSCKTSRHGSTSCKTSRHGSSFCETVRHHLSRSGTGSPSL